MSKGKRKAEDGAPSARSVGIFMLGMHRSGTSVVTRVLSLLGCALPSDLLGANESNPTGHWESLRVIEINDALLSALGRRWDDVRELPADWLQRPETATARLQIRAFIDREFSSAKLWLLKDPRLCRLAPLWIEVASGLGVDIRVIVPVRHPTEVAYSLARRDAIGQGQGQLLWCQHLVEAERATREQTRVLVHFEDVVADWRAEAIRIASTLEIALATDSATVAEQIEAFITPALLHSDASDESGILTGYLAPAKPVSELYAGLRKVRGVAAWQVIADAAKTIAQSSSLFWPAIDDISQRAERIERRASATNDLLSAKLAGSGAWLLNEVEIRKLLLETETILGRIDEAKPLSLELIRQVEAQRKEISAAAVSQVADIRSLADRMAESSPMVAELINQVEAQRKEIGAAAVSQGADIRALADRMAESSPMLAELINQIEAQRRQIADAASISAGENALRIAQFSEAAAALELALALQLEQSAAAAAAAAAREQFLVSQLEQSCGALDARDKALAEYREHAESLEGRNSELSHEVALQSRQLSELLTSTSWKLTSPLRFVRRFLSGKPTLEGHDRTGLLKSVYLAFPMPWSMRLRIKSALFLLFTPFLRNTGAYRRWQSKRVVPLAFPVAYAVDKPLPPNQITIATARTNSGPQAYVPLAPEPVNLEELCAKLIAFYLPQFHPIPENDEWWGRGFTEWTNVSKAVPQFDGHEQPHLPGELGFYDLRLPEVMERQIELAKHYGVHGFCFHYYWFDGRRVLERPLEQFIGNPSFDFPFCICWANENWTRRWDGHDNDVLLGQKHTAESDLRFIQDIEPILRDPRYIRVGGRPLLIVYRPALLPDCADTVARWRTHCRDVGIGEILLVMVQFDAEDPRPFGFDVAVEFPPHKLARNLPSINASLPSLNPDFTGYVIDYQELVEQSKNWPVPEFNLIRGVFPGWDNEARKPQQGYMFAHSSPERYRDWLASAVDYSRQHPIDGESLVFVNAWNEWAEGAYLEPDRRYGYAYLEATRNALTGGATAQQNAQPAGKVVPRVVVVSHDAHPHGAQYLSVNLCRELSRTLGGPVDAVLLGGGFLEGEFRQAAKVHELFCGGGTQAGAELARRLKAEGVDFAIANTTVSGKFVSDLKRAGIRVLSLVHELPGVIESMALQDHAKLIARDADLVVFASNLVREGFERFAPLDPARVLIRPQGLYKRNRYQSLEEIAAVRSDLRQRLALPADALIVLSVGYADLRKGADLFVEIGERLVRGDSRVHMVWLGHPDLGLEPILRAKIKATGLSGHFHFPGRDSDTDPYYAGSDLYALTSREDPFPTVIMEAFDVCLPVVAFAGVGGFDGLLERAGGRLVPALEVERYAHECAELLSDPAARRRLGREGKAVVDDEFSFPDYVHDLLGRFGLAQPRVSVVVPNYNYARYLQARLGSVVGQTLVPYEVIVLDDGSTDDSLAVLAELGKTMPLRIIPSEQNSGSVFRQWQKGVRAARGDFVWIAEADDLSELDFLSKVMPAFADPGVVMSYCQSQQVGEHAEQLCPDYLDYVADFGADRWRKDFVADLDQELAHGLAVKNTIPNVSAVVFRRAALADVLDRHADEIAGYRIAGDWLTYLHVLAGGSLAFCPQSLNLHRRHAAGVTIGADHRPHLEEVRSVQSWVAQRFPLQAQTSQAAEKYLEYLKAYFGLENAQV